MLVNIFVKDVCISSEPQSFKMIHFSKKKFILTSRIVEEPLSGDSVTFRGIAFIFKLSLINGKTIRKHYWT